MNYKVTIFEDNKIAPLNNFSGQEIQSLENIISNFHSEHMDLPYYINDEETAYGALYNVDEEIMKKYENKRIIVNPPQYGVNPWGKVELLFEKDNTIINFINKEIENITISKEKDLTEKEVKKSKSKKNKPVMQENKKSIIKEEKLLITNDNESNFYSIDEEKVKNNLNTNNRPEDIKISNELIQQKDNLSIEFTNKKSSDKKIRKCNNCKNIGHNIRTCPLLNK